MLLQSFTALNFHLTFSLPYLYHRMPLHVQVTEFLVKCYRLS